MYRWPGGGGWSGTKAKPIAAAAKELDAAIRNFEIIGGAAKQMSF
jgi:hypothetical protein